MEQAKAYHLEWQKFGTFKHNILKFIKIHPKKFFDCYNHREIRLMTQLRLGLSHIREHKFNNFQNCISPLCCCGMDIESSSHFFPHCPLLDDKRVTLLSTLSKIYCKIIETNESSLTETLLFGSSLFHSKKDSLILKTHPLITFHPLKDSKNPCLTFLNN